MALRLRSAVSKGYFAQFQAELEAGAPVNEADSDGTTALHWAAGRGDSTMARLLLEARAVPNTPNCMGFTPLHMAVSRDYGEVARVLLDAGADTALRDGQGSAPLELAAKWGSLALAKCLLDHSADPTARGEDGETALDKAYEAGRDVMIELLQGALEAWTRQFVLQLTIEGSVPEVQLTCRTLAGNIAAVLPWNTERPVQELPGAVVDAVRASGFECPIQPLRVSNLRLVSQSGVLLSTAPEAATLLEQVAGGA